MNATSRHAVEAFSQADENIQPDVYITYDAQSDVTIYYEGDEITLDLGYND